jgi:hypothetical protein
MLHRSDTWRRSLFFSPADKAAIDKVSAGDVITIFTPDPTHFDIAKYAIERNIHVLVTKPAVMTLEHHRELVELAQKHKVLVMVEFHKVCAELLLRPFFLGSETNVPPLHVLFS